MLLNTAFYKKQAITPDMTEKNTKETMLEPRQTKPPNFPVQYSQKATAQMRAFVVSAVAFAAKLWVGFLNGLETFLPGNDMTIAIVALAAKLSKADGIVDDSEIVALKRRITTDEVSWKRIERFFKLSQKTTLGFEAYAELIARRQSHRPEYLKRVLALLVAIAEADGKVDPKEIEFIAVVADRFGVQAHFTNPDHDPAPERETLSHARRILEIGADAKQVDIRRAYLRLARRNHPDINRSENTTAKTQDMAEINAAYDFLRKKVKPQKKT